MITDRDRKIISHLEKYKYATIEQLEKIFFRHQKNSYTIVRRRMAEIRKAGYVKSVRNMEINRVVYIYNDGKTKLPDRHRLIVLDVLANLYYQGFKVQTFDVEKFWMSGEIRSDAFTIFTLESVKNRYHYFIEVHLSNNHCNLEKYDILYEIGQVQEYLGRNIYPRILLVTDKEVEYNLNHCQVITLNTKLDEFASIILPNQYMKASTN